MNLGAPEVLLVMLVILIFFGPSKIPELAKGLGKGLREFRKASREIQEDIEKEIKQVDVKEEPKKLNPPL
jgi:sec-independent protein translocase protein TatA